MIKWQIYYDDGSTFSDEDGLPAEAPGHGIQIIAEADPVVGLQLQSGKDFWIRRNDRWIGVDLVGLLDHLVSTGHVKQGRMLTNAEFSAVQTRALSDRRLARKSARHPDER